MALAAQKHEGARTPQNRQDVVEEAADLLLPPADPAGLPGPHPGRRRRRPPAAPRRTCSSSHRPPASRLIAHADPHPALPRPAVHRRPPPARLGERAHGPAGGPTATANCTRPWCCASPWTTTPCASSTATSWSRCAGTSPWPWRGCWPAASSSRRRGCPTPAPCSAAPRTPGNRWSASRSGLRAHPGRRRRLQRRRRGAATLLMAVPGTLGLSGGILQLGHAALLRRPMEQEQLPGPCRTSWCGPCRAAARTGRRRPWPATPPPPACSPTPRPCLIRSTAVAAWARWRRAPMPVCWRPTSATCGAPSGCSSRCCPPASPCGSIRPMSPASASTPDHPPSVGAGRAAGAGGWRPLRRRLPGPGPALVCRRLLRPPLAPPRPRRDQARAVRAQELTHAPVQPCSQRESDRPAPGHSQGPPGRRADPASGGDLPGPGRGRPAVPGAADPHRLRRRPGAAAEGGGPAPLRGGGRRRARHRRLRHPGRDRGRPAGAGRPRLRRLPLLPVRAGGHRPRPPPRKPHLRI